MDTVEVSTVVRVEQRAVYEFLLDFAGYADYSPYLRTVEADGPGGAGTRYDLEVAWWRLAFTVHSEVTAVDPPRRIRWALVEDIDARGHWTLEPADGAVASDEVATRVTLVVRIDPESVDGTSLGLSRFVPIGAVRSRGRAVLEAEAERTLERVVADLEGESRPVDLRVRTGADTGE